jgi:hypothetical protein
MLKVVEMEIVQTSAASETNPSQVLDLRLSNLNNPFVRPQRLIH